MIRAVLTIVCMVTIIVVVGLPMVLIGLVYPFRVVFSSGTRFWAWAMLAATGIRLTVEGQEHIEQGGPFFFVGNHQGAMDIPVLLLALKGDIRFLAKRSLFRIPIFGGLLSRYGHIPLDRTWSRDALRELDRRVERMRHQRVSWVAFPEGTRSPSGRLLPFRKGMMKICGRAGLPVVPFTVEGSGKVKPRDRLVAVPGPVRLRFMRPIPAEEVAAMTPDQLHERVRGAIAESLGQQSGCCSQPEQATVSESN